MRPKIDPNLLEVPVFKRVKAGALAIQDRFAAKASHHLRTKLDT